MQRAQHLATNLFLAAGAYNVFGILLFSHCFTNPLMAAADPVVFSWFGQVSILLWGLAYWSIAKNYAQNLGLVSVFFIEKMVYAITWLLWILNYGDSLSALYTQSFMTAFFFSAYGAGDFLFGLFFLWVCIRFK